MRASRAFSDRQPSVSSSTSSARSSMRAFRSESSVASIRSRRRIELFVQALDLGQAARDRRRLLAQALAERLADLVSMRATSSTLPSASDGRRELDYDLPPELIAQQPPERRDASRLLVFDRATRRGPAHRVFASCRRAAAGRRSTVVNDTRVVPARIPIERPRGEVLLLERVGGDEWEALARPTRRLRRRARATAGRSSCSSTWARAAGACGSTASPPARVPLPPYITAPLADPEPLPDGLCARRRARRPRRPPACTSRRSCSRGSTSSA